MDLMQRNKGKTCEREIAALVAVLSGWTIERSIEAWAAVARELSGQWPTLERTAT